MNTDQRTWTEQLGSAGLRALLDVIRRKHWSVLLQSEIALVDRVQETIDRDQRPSLADLASLQALVARRLSEGEREEVMKSSACPHDPDGQHHVGCGCDAEDGEEPWCDGCNRADAEMKRIEGLLGLDPSDADRDAAKAIKRVNGILVTSGSETTEQAAQRVVEERDRLKDEQVRVRSELGCCPEEETAESAKEVRAARNRLQRENGEYRHDLARIRQSLGCSDGEVVEAVEKVKAELERLKRYEGWGEWLAGEWINPIQKMVGLDTDAGLSSTLEAVERVVRDRDGYLKAAEEFHESRNRRAAKCRELEREVGELRVENERLRTHPEPLRDDDGKPMVVYVGRQNPTRCYLIPADAAGEHKTDSERFNDHLADASKKVSEWPDWKRNALVSKTDAKRADPEPTTSTSTEATGIAGAREILTTLRDYRMPSERQFHMAAEALSCLDSEPDAERGGDSTREQRVNSEAPPLTQEEAEEAYNNAEPVEISEEEVERMVKHAANGLGQPSYEQKAKAIARLAKQINADRGRLKRQVARLEVGQEHLRNERNAARQEAEQAQRERDGLVQAVSKGESGLEDWPAGEPVENTVESAILSIEETYADYDKKIKMLREAEQQAERLREGLLVLRGYTKGRVKMFESELLNMREEIDKLLNTTPTPPPPSPEQGVMGEEELSEQDREWLASRPQTEARLAEQSQAIRDWQEIADAWKAEADRLKGGDT